MTRVPLTGAASPAAQTTSQAQGNDLRDLELDQFLQLLITELQNQDPLNPLDNAQILQQIGQIREIGATNLLTETLDTVLTGQNLSTASGLIGKEITALSDDLEEVQGVVDRVTVDVNEETQARSLRVHVGDQAVAVTNIRQIVGDTPAP